MIESRFVRAAHRQGAHVVARRRCSAMGVAQPTNERLRIVLRRMLKPRNAPVW